MSKVVVITGVGKGFGRRLLLELSESYHVVGITRSSDDLTRLQDEYPQLKHSSDLIALDLTSNSDLVEKLSPLLNQYAENIYGLINNAGVRLRKQFLETSTEDVAHVLRTNTIAPIMLTKLILPFMLKNKAGRIINISSILASKSLPDLSIYSSSKGALSTFSRSIACEYAPYGITSNALLPGFCETSYYKKFSENVPLFQMTLSRIPAGKWGSDREIVGICSFLLSSDANYINGVEIPIDGGWLA